MTLSRAKMRNPAFISHLVACLLLSLLVLTLLVTSGCGKTCLDTTGIEQKYLDAINDAKVAEPHEVFRELTAIVKDNDNLIWESEPCNSRVLVVTWTGKPYYDDYVGRDYYLPANAEVWVTVVPELKDFFNDAGSCITRLRMEQLLGLPPKSGKTKFVEIWVNPNDLFRPSPDPEITDREAELDFPISNRFVDVTEAYKIWFNNLEEISYQGDYAHPWTRLGYTYDWGNENNHVGLSEFVIAGNSTLGIASITETYDYLK